MTLNPFDMTEEPTTPPTRLDAALGALLTAGSLLALVALLVMERGSVWR